MFLHGRRTTNLGFGCSSLGSLSPVAARRLLEEAFAAGIRHFDVAPMYGFGEAERLLREALGTHMREVTLTTKYGLLPARPSPVRRVARMLLQPFAAWTARLRQRAVSHEEEPVEDPSLPPLSAAEAQLSLERSLTNLGVDCLDLFLLHEATPGRLRDDELLEMLERNRTAGKIAQFGVGSRSARVAACLASRPLLCPFVQYEWSVFSRPRPQLESLPRIVHGSLGHGYTPSPTQLGCWSELTGLDLQAPGVLERVLLKASLLHHAGHIVLFSTRSADRLHANVRAAADHTLEGPARALLTHVQVEAAA